MNVDVTIEGILQREGGYIDNPADRGGPTQYGITQAVARAHGYTGDLRDLPQSLARSIYRDTYVQQPGFDKVEALAPGIGVELVDTGVNMGISVAANFLQRLLNVLNREGKLYPDIHRDGHIGHETLSALGAYVHARGAQGIAVLLRGLECLRGERYVELAEYREQDETFVYGWLLNRVEIPT